MTKLNIHHIMPVTTVNGPGKRIGIWLQGCNLNCKGCFNPKTHSFEQNILYETDKLFEEIKDSYELNEIEGISFSGGEPFLQSKALYELLVKAKKKIPKLTVLIFSGFTIDEIEKDEDRNKILNFVDVLIAGRYEVGKNISNDKKSSLLSSLNQKIHLLTDRYSYKDFFDAKNQEVKQNIEVVIDKKGNVVVTGIK